MLLIYVKVRSVILCLIVVGSVLWIEAEANVQASMWKQPKKKSEKGKMRKMTQKATQKSTPYKLIFLEQAH